MWTIPHHPPLSFPEKSQQTFQSKCFHVLNRYKTYNNVHPASRQVICRENRKY